MALITSNPIYPVIVRCDHCSQVLEKHRYKGIRLGPEHMKCKDCGTENVTGDIEWHHMRFDQKINYWLSLDLVLIITVISTMSFLLLFGVRSMIYFSRSVLNIYTLYGPAFAYLGYRVYIKKQRIQESKMRSYGLTIEQPEEDLDEI